MTGTPLDDLTDEQIIAGVRAMNHRRMWQDRADAARWSAWMLWAMSLMAMGATFAAINDRDWGLAAGFALVMLLLARAAGSERAEMRACLREIK